jgi:thioesterase domain-containing protein
MLSADQATAFVHDAVPALGRFGLQVQELEPGRVRLTLPFEGNGNHMGTMYAGALFAIAELPGGLLPLSLVPQGVVPIMKELTIRFLSPARGEVYLTAELDPGLVQRLAAQARDTGRAEFTLDLQVTDSRGRAVAATTGHYQLRPA